MYYLEHKGHNISFREEGKGIPVILLHGFCEDSKLWNDFLPRLSTQARTILIDLPGFGQSTLGEAACNIEEMADCVVAVVNALELTQFIIIGHSMGGYVSLAVAESCPERLLGLGLFHSHPYPDNETQRAAREKSIDFIEKNGHVLYAKQLFPQLFSPNFNGEFVTNQLVLRASRGTARGMTNALVAMRDRSDRSETLQNAAYPVLFIIGEEDSRIPLDTSLTMSHLPSTAQIEILPKTGHLGMYERPRETALMVSKFISLCQDIQINVV